MKKSWVTFVLATTLLGLTGCASNNATKNNANNIGVNNVRNNDNNGVNVRNVSNQNLRVSSRAIRNVESLKEVNKAHVIIRGNDAYVAVRLAGNQNGYLARGATTGTDTTGTGSTGTGPNMNGTYSNGYNSGTTGTNGAANLNANTGNTTNNYNAGTTNVPVNNSLNQKIIKKVRAADRNIDHVHVSYDTNTFGQMTNYSNSIRTGTNRDGLWHDFTNSVNRMFR